MIHKLYSAYDLPADHDVCHLFEHLVIRRFLHERQKNLAMSARSSANYTAQHPNQACFLMSRSLLENRSRYLKKLSPM